MKNRLTIIFLAAIFYQCDMPADKLETSERNISADISAVKRSDIVDCESLKEIFKPDTTMNSDTLNFLKFKSITGFSCDKLKGQDSLLIMGQISNSFYFKNCKDFQLEIVSKNNLRHYLYSLVVEIDSNCNILRYLMKKNLNQETGGCEMFDFYVKSDSLEKIIISHPTADRYTFKDYLELKRKFMSTK